jgi:hypothetical protein
MANGIYPSGMYNCQMKIRDRKTGKMRRCKHKISIKDFGKREENLCSHHIKLITEGDNGSGIRLDDFSKSSFLSSLEETSETFTEGDQSFSPHLRFGSSCSEETPEDFTGDRSFPPHLHAEKRGCLLEKDNSCLGILTLVCFITYIFLILNVPHGPFTF